jgi:hypothetical protein
MITRQSYIVKALVVVSRDVLAHLRQIQDVKVVTVNVVVSQTMNVVMVVIILVVQRKQILLVMKMQMGMV